ncbi:hypothetical protein BDV18DRAFT_112901 [Aspergillus unguis]
MDSQVWTSIRSIAKPLRRVTRPRLVQLVLTGLSSRSQLLEIDWVCNLTLVDGPRVASLRPTQNVTPHCTRTRRSVFRTWNMPFEDSSFRSWSDFNGLSSGPKHGRRHACRTAETKRFGSRERHPWYGRAGPMKASNATRAR